MNIEVAKQLYKENEKIRELLLSIFTEEELGVSTIPTQEEFNTFFEDEILSKIDSSKTIFPQKNNDIKVEKYRYKIWNWYIEKVEVNMSLNPTGYPIYWYSLNGISDKYEKGYPTRTSKIIRLDFESCIVETLNSIFELQSEIRSYPFSNDKNK